MVLGTKVMIVTKDKNDSPINDFGYLLKEINTHCCEIWCEKHQTIMCLSQEDFIAIKESNE